MRRTHLSAVAGTLAVAALVAACGSSTAPSARPVAPHPGPAGLVGIWRVTGTESRPAPGCACR